MAASSPSNQKVKTPPLDRPARMAEFLVIILSCVAPWGFGAVDAWAIFVLDVGVALVAILTSISLWRSSDRAIVSVPGVALASLTLLAVLQALPISPSTLRFLEPTTSAERGSLIPNVPERVFGDEKPIIPLPSGTVSLSPHDSIHTASQLAAAFVLFQCVVQLGGGLAALRRFAAAIVLNATALSLFALLQALAWNGSIYGILPNPSAGKWAGGGPFVCHNHQAEYLNLGLGFAIGLLLGGQRSQFNTKDKGSRLWTAYACGVLVIGVLVSLSRGGFIAMTLAAASTTIILRLIKFRIRIGLGFLAVPAIILVLLVTIGDTTRFADRVSTILEGSENDSFAARLMVWKCSWQSWLDHPIWGSGFGTFPIATEPYFIRDTGHTYLRAENDLIDLAVEGGLLGLGLGVLALLSIAWQARKALLAADTTPGQGLLVGSIFGALAILFHVQGDFGLHIPGVAFVVVVLVARLVRLGIDAGGPINRSKVHLPNRFSRILLGSGLVTAMCLVVVHQAGQFKSELPLIGSGIPRSGVARPSILEIDQTLTELEEKRRALECSLQSNPDWTEGHLWLGKVYLEQYLLAEHERRTGVAAASTGNASLDADPLTLLREAFSVGRGTEILARATHQGDPVRDYLIPAAREFLDARRCNPFSALAQAKLASLVFLLNDGRPSAVYVERALKLAGGDESIVDFLAQVSLRIGRPDLAARCWRRSLELRPAVWSLVADSAVDDLMPDQILDNLLVQGKDTLLFAERLFTDPELHLIQEKYFRAALKRLPHDPDLELSERLWLESQAWAGLDNRAKAREQMLAVLKAEPMDPDRRARCVQWLIKWDDYTEAHRQAVTGVSLNPNHYGMQRALKQAADALARGKKAGP